MKYGKYWWQSWHCLYEKTNLTKSSAFIEREDVIYYIRLGYTLDYQQSGVSIPLKKPCDSVTQKFEKMVRDTYPTAEQIDWKEG